MNPIEKAVTPMKEDAVRYAVEQAEKRVAETWQGLEAAGFDLDVYAPYPQSGYVSREKYKQMMAFRSFVKRITTYNPDKPTRMMHEPEIRVLSEGAKQRFLEEIASMAGASFDAYVAKLTKKVGECIDAQVNGMLWSYSILRVTKEDGSIEQWKTQMIVNCSCLGTLFNQWPTRKMK